MSPILLFRIAQVEVSASPSYLLLIVWCVSWFRDEPLFGIVAAIAVTASIIIHEFGHALVCKRYDLAPSITLHGLGGLCFHRPAESDLRSALIALSGPLLQIGAGLALAALAWGLGALPSATSMLDLEGWARLARAIPSRALGVFASVFIGVSLLWGALNLIAPIWPLDGGKLFSLALRRVTSDARASAWVLRVSIALLALIGAWAIWSRSWILILLVAITLWENARALSAGTILFEAPRRRKGRASEFARSLFERAMERVDEGDWAEGARLCHQLRATREALPAAIVDAIWLVLAYASLERGERDEALGWLNYFSSPETRAELIEACEAAPEGELGAVREAIKRSLKPLRRAKGMKRGRRS